MQCQLLERFPEESGAKDPAARMIPFLPGECVCVCVCVCVQETCDSSLFRQEVVWKKPHQDSCREEKGKD